MNTLGLIGPRAVGERVNAVYQSQLSRRIAQNLLGHDMAYLLIRFISLEIKVLKNFHLGLILKGQ